MNRNKVSDLAARCGGMFKFTVLLQKRVQELVRGAPKLTKEPGTNPIDIAFREIEEGLITLESMSQAEIEEQQRSLEEQVAAQSLLNKEQPGTPGEPSTRSISEYLKS